MDFKAAVLEKRYVHEVYEKIASEVGQADYRVWPKVEQFLRSLPTGSLVADIGCGHGKYLDINSGITVLGSDRCTNLVEIARQCDHQVLISDNINLPYRSNSFDAVISIAVIHHFTTSARRLKALQELVRILRPGGKLMVYVWALEQKQRKFEGQDVLVPWHPTRLKRIDKRRNFVNGFSRMEELRSSSPAMHQDEQLLRAHCDCEEITDQRLTQNNGLLNNHITGIENSPTGNLSKMLSCFSVESDDDDVYGVPEEAKLQKQENEDSFFVRLGKSWKLPRLSSPSIKRKTEDDALKEVEVISSCCKYAQEKKKGMNDIKTRLVRDSSLSGSSSDTDSDGSIDYKLPGFEVPGCETPPPSPTLQRFYHVFQKGELSTLMKRGIPKMDVVNEYYDHANWAVIAVKKL